MEIKEALTYWQEKLNAFEEFDPNDFFLEEYRQAHTNYLEAIRVVISALEKQVPKCPIKYRQLSIPTPEHNLIDYDSARCPCCNKDIWGTTTERARYCQNCGQKLWW